ncbi:MAG TPA: DUF2235 domain-containing protein [Candidatus Binatia bacterium]|jgi:uncharacterized protein (DUF2235 family)
MKKLILCCDGTWNSADQENAGVPCPTNVVKLGYRVAKRDGATPQIIYYDQGVGTGNVLDRASGGALGEGLEDNIHDAYRFLVANYEPDDELYLFGFSRGAFTARSIGGMIRKCGILRREFVQHYRDAIALYRSEDHPDDEVPKKFRKDYSVSATDIQIKFIGVWDTVGALGIPLRGLRWITRGEHQFHDTALSGTVEHAYHALAIDEHRAPFEPTLWAYKPKDGQKVEQVWFCGAHSDVGGGYAQVGLSDIALEWMMGKARGAGLAFDDTTIAARPLHPDPRGELHNSKTGLYRATPGIDRPIGFSTKDPKNPTDAPKQADPTQSVHESVRARWDGDPSYRPSSLRDYFKRSGDARGEER